MLKLILGPDFYRFLLKMNFISNGMAKTSVITMKGGWGWGVPSAKLSTVLLESALGDTRRASLANYLPGTFFCCVSVYSCRHQPDDRSRAAVCADNP